METLTNVLQSVNGWLNGHIDISVLVLVLLLASMVQILRAAQKRDDVDLVDLLRDADKKISTPATAGMGAFIFSSWVLMHDALSGTLTDPQWFGYLLFWSGAPVANVLANKWDGTLPWSKRQ